MPGGSDNQFRAIVDRIRRGVTPEEKRRLIAQLRQLQAEGSSAGRIPLDILGGGGRAPVSDALVPVPKEPSPVRLTNPNAPPQYTGTARPRGTRAIPARDAGALVPIPRSGGGGAVIPGGGGGGGAIPSGGARPAPRFGMQPGNAGPYTRLGDAPTGMRTPPAPASGGGALARVGPTSLDRIPAPMGGGGGGGGVGSAIARYGDDVAKTVGRKGLSPNWKKALAGAGLVAGAVALNALKDNRQGEDLSEFEGSAVPPSQRDQKPPTQVMKSKPAEADMPAYKGQGPMSKAMGVTRNDDGKVDANKVKLGQGWMFDMTRRIGQKGFDQPGMERRGQKLGSSGRDDIAQMFRTSDYANKELNLSEREINAAVEAFKRDFNKQQFKGQSYAADRLPRGTSAPAGTVVPRKVLSTPEYRARYGR